MPPLDEKALKKLKDNKMIFQFKIEEGLYNIDNLDGFMGEEEEKPKPKKTEEKPKKEEEKKKLPVKPAATNRLKDKLAAKPVQEVKRQ